MRESVTLLSAQFLGLGVRLDREKGTCYSIKKLISARELSIHEFLL